MKRYSTREGKAMKCVFCSKGLDVNAKVGRNDTCPQCGKGLHCCKQCKFYDPNAFNQCREVSAIRIVDKERANRCEYFILRGSPALHAGMDKVKQAKKALEALFKKK
jgi:hypothetical protein